MTTLRLPIEDDLVFVDKPNRNTTRYVSHAYIPSALKLCINREKQILEIDFIYLLKEKPKRNESLTDKVDIVCGSRSGKLFYIKLNYEDKRDAIRELHTASAKMKKLPSAGQKGIKHIAKLLKQLLIKEIDKIDEEFFVIQDIEYHS